MTRSSACLALLSTIVAHSIASADSIDEAAFIAELEQRDPRKDVQAAKVETARAEVVGARVRPNPSISYEREVPYVDGSGLATNYLRLSLPLDISGRRGLSVAAATSGVDATTSEAKQARHEATVEALRIYDDCVAARLRVQILTEGRTALVRAVDVARERSKTGAASGYEVQRFELELAAHDDELATAQIDLRRARVRLATLLGRTGELDAAGTLEIPTVPALDSLLAKATERGDLRATQQRADAARHREEAAGRSWIPLPTVMAGAMTADMGDQTGTGYVAGVSLSIPIFDRGQGERARAAADRHLAVAEGRWLQRQIPSAVQTAHATLIARIAQLERVATEQIARLDTILRATEVGFKEGTASVVELLDAHRTARTVRLRELDLRHQVARDKRELEVAVGHRL